jgi:V/A-type H+/Na+-transporting ATPase subunit I
MLVKMAKVEIVGIKDLFFDVLETLQDMGILHLEDISKKQGPRYATLVPMEMDPAMEEEKGRLQNLAMRNNAILAELAPPAERVSRNAVKEQYNYFSGKTLEDIAAVVEEEETALKGLIGRKQELEVEMSRLSKYEPIIKKVYPLASQVTTSEHYTSIALLVEKKYVAVLDYIKDELDKITNKQCEIHTARVDEDTYAAIVIFNKLYSESVHNFLAAENVNQVRLPSELADKPYDEALQEIEARFKELPPQLAKVQKEIDEISDKWYVQLLALKEYLADRVSSLDVIPKFGQSGHVFVITGWMPADKVNETRRTLEQKFEGKVELTEEAVSHEEMESAPVELRNNPVIKPFEFIYILVRRPKYGVIDPTFIVAIFFPLLFGFMLGDMGYALVLMAGVYFMKRWIKKNGKENSIMSLFANVLLISSISSFIFGFIYLEFFGNILLKAFNIEGTTAAGVEYFNPVIVFGETANGKEWGWPVERAAQVNKDMFKLLLIVVLGIGALQMSLGLIIGIIDRLREGERKHAIEKIGWLMVIMGIVIALFFTWAFKVKPGALAGVLIALVGVGLGAYGGGFGGGIEAVLIFGNILSYARLYGIALASVIMANVANELAAEFGGWWIAVGIIVAALLHTLNLALGVLSPSIQSLRLNLVETFNKFYQESEEEYSPFKKTGGE